MPGPNPAGVLLALLAVAGCEDDAASSSGGGDVSSSGAAGAGSSSPSSSVVSGGGGVGGLGGVGGSGGAPYVPEPIPEIDPEPPALCANPQPADYFQFLDDTCGAKVFPSYEDRDVACAVDDASPTVTLADGTTVTYAPMTAPIVIEDTLTGIVPDELFVTVILIRRVGGVPHVRYLSNGSAETAYQPWSTTKVFAAANAASRLRIASDYELGLTASVSGYELGDLVTSVCNYDYNPFSSNSLGRYFHDVGGRARANDLIHALWLNRPASETFGGNYGEASPGIGYSFTEPSGETLSITPDTSAGPANHLSSLTVAEALKRLVIHREVEEQRLPGIQWADIETILYGARESTEYGFWGGMSRDTAIYLQTGHDPAYLDMRSKGHYRMFSKLGLGTSGQFLNVGYACLPVLDNAEQPVPGWGREFVIAAHLPTTGASWADRDRNLARAYRAIITRIVDGRL